MMGNPMGNLLGNPLGLPRVGGVNGALVKSMQRGFVDFSTFLVNVPLEKTVDPSRCIVLVDSGSRSGVGLPSTAGCTGISEAEVAFKLSGNGTTFSWTLLEFGNIKPVTRGSVTLPSNSVQVPIPIGETDLSKACVLLSVSPDTVFTSSHELWHLSTWFDYGAALVKRSTSGQALVIDYQILEFN